jgi:hypothetical protein
MFAIFAIELCLKKVENFRMKETRPHSTTYPGELQDLRGPLGRILFSISLISSLLLFSETLKAEDNPPQLVLPVAAEERVSTDRKRTYLTLSSNLNETYSWSERKQSIFDDDSPNASNEVTGLRGVYIEFALAPQLGMSGFQYRMGIAVTNPTKMPSGSLRAGVPDIQHDETGFRFGVGYKFWRAYADLSMLFPMTNSPHENYKLTNQGISAFELDGGFEIVQNICLELFYKEFHFTVEPTDNAIWRPLEAEQKVIGTRLRLRM